MCGICGQYNFLTGKPVQADLISSMMKTIVHRGPDDNGSYISDAIGLGFQRLSIIDLAGGHQPMSDMGGTIWVIFNGEIYNFSELRQELEARGHVFRTRSDTEVIVYGYKEWGDRVLDRLNGMFGLAIWDSSARRLLLARDRAGIKLVYYRLDGDGILFGSEIRPILSALPETPSMDPAAVNLFLRYRYTPSPLTLFDGIRKLAPGTCLVAENGSVKVKRYWNYSPAPLSPLPSVENVQEELLFLYKRAVKRQLISDVPLGLLLSGGLDSGMLLALMESQNEVRKTFTVGFGLDSFADDELNDAAETARILDSPNYPILIDQSDFEDVLSRVTEILEEPVATASVVPMYFVCQKARQEVKTALIGQGPDELFAGYKRHLGVRYGSIWRSIPGPLRHAVSAALHALPRNESIKRGLYSLDESDRIRRYQQVFSILPGSIIDGLFKGGLLPDNPGDRILDCWSDLIPLSSNVDELAGFNFLEIRSSLPDELLMYADKLSMTHSLELRVPYLDHDIIEYVEKLPCTFKIKYGSRKWIHKRVCRSLLPPEIINRKKRGFASNVVDDWFRASVRSDIDRILSDPHSLMYGFLQFPKVQNLVENHKKGSGDYHKILFSLVILEQWLRVFRSHQG